VICRGSLAVRPLADLDVMTALLADAHLTGRQLPQRTGWQADPPQARKT
jgi:hypothetical protein